MQVMHTSALGVAAGTPANTTPPAAGANASRGIINSRRTLFPVTDSPRTDQLPAATATEPPTGATEETAPSTSNTQHAAELLGKCNFSNKTV